MTRLREYREKRRFAETPEPKGRPAQGAGNRFVVQKHAARRLHYDFRLEIDGVLKSWAVPKGPSLNPKDKRLAVETEDHPIEYGDFEGVIPKGQYGAGTVMVWDRGRFENAGPGSPAEQFQRGELKFVLHGRKLRGGFVLVKLKRSEKGKDWLLIKHRDAAVDAEWTPDDQPESILSGRTLKEIAEGAPPGAPAGPNPGALEGARQAALPMKVEPTLATLVEKPFSDPEWIFELKWDGVRTLARVRDGKLELRSRRGRLITSHYPELAVLPERLRARQVILDGEIVVLDERGRPAFERLQERMHVARPAPALRRRAPVIYYLFDILYCDGYDLREAPLLERKRLLREVVEFGDPIRFSDHQREKGKELFELAHGQELEGIVGKHARSPYLGRRSPYWVKFKSRREADVVIGGWTEPRGAGYHLGALLAGLYEGKKLRCVGGVGSGFSQRQRKQLYKRLHELETRRCPFDAIPKTQEKAHWIKPELVARVEFAEWTRERQLRAPVFVELRDLDPEDCRFESEQPAPRPPAVVQAPAVVRPLLRREKEIEKELSHGREETVHVKLDGIHLRLTHLNKVFFPDAGYTKRDLLAYYYRMAGRLLPFLRGRPLVLRRYPNGIEGESFFQKEAGETAPDWMETVAIESEGRRQAIRYYVAQHTAALLYLTNLGCIDHNPWASRTDDLEHPDYVFFDLDPAERTEFSSVVKVAQAVHRTLDALKLPAYLKTSGATGFHLYVPIERRYTYEQTRTFAEIVGRLVAAELPAQVTGERSVEKRQPGKVYIDAYQNAYGRPLAAPYSVRAFPGAPVSAPVRPEELKAGLRPGRYHLKSLPAHLDRRGDPWADFWKHSARLEKATEVLSRLVAGRRGGG